jgi:signal transduction histidine kinase
MSRPASFEPARVETTEERHGRLSLLQELTVAALDIFEPSHPLDPFLHRIGERLGCLVVAWLTVDGAGETTLVAAAGLSEASRALALEPTAASTAPEAVKLPYPEVAGVGVRRLSFPLGSAAASEPVSLLLLFFDSDSIPADCVPVLERLSVVLRKVWSHRRLTEELRESFASLARTRLELIERERLAAAGELSAMIAHEIRNPLGVISNCIGTLEKPGVTPAEIHTLTSILKDETARLMRLASGLLDEGEERGAVLEHQSLEEVVAGVIATVRGIEPEVESESVRLELSVAPSVPALWVDVRLVRRALINAICSLVQRTHRGGSVTVRIDGDVVDQRAAARLELASHPPVDGASSPPPSRRRSAGSDEGLSLAIVERMVEAHRGTLTHGSRPESPALTIRLPALGHTRFS